MNFRIAKTEIPFNGYIVQRKKKTFWSDEWVDFVTYVGSDTAYPFRTVDDAIYEAQKWMKHNIFRNTESEVFETDPADSGNINK